MADRDAPAAALLIDGARVPAASGATAPVRNPATGAVLAHGSIYGLSGSLWTRDIGRALRVVRSVETGVISVNTGWSVHADA